MGPIPSGRLKNPRNVDKSESRAGGKLITLNLPVQTGWESLSPAVMKY